MSRILFTVNNFVTLTETVEDGCLRHPGATTIGSQLQDGDRTDGWQNLTAMSPHALDKTGTCHTPTQWKAKGGEGRKQKHNAPTSRPTDK